MDIASTIWGTAARKGITVSLGTITALAGAIVAVPPAWTQLGLPEAATKGYVEQVVQPLRFAQQTYEKTARDIQIDIAEGKKAQTEDAKAKWNLELGRAKDPSTKMLIQGQIRELQTTSDRLTDQIKTLRYIDR